MNFTVGYIHVVQIVHPLRTWRKARQINQATLARLLGVSLAHISQIETGVNAPSLALAARIERTTGGDVRAIDLVREKVA